MPGGERRVVGCDVRGDEGARHGSGRGAAGVEDLVTEALSATEAYDMTREQIDAN